jgi:hypothetical protein
MMLTCRFERMRQPGSLTLQATNGHRWLGQITTVFDLKTKRIDRHITVLGCYDRRDSYAVNELAGIGIKESHAESGYSYMPMLVRQGGQRRYLATLSGGYPKFAAIIEEISEATGLPMLEISGFWGGTVNPVRR